MSDTIRVVIVDDERLFAELLRVAMRSADDIDVVAVAHDVRSAITAVGEARPDVVLADYHLPDGTGADLARSVRSSLPKTAVVVLTGDPSAFTLADVARSGAVGHLTKERAQRAGDRDRAAHASRARGPPSSRERREHRRGRRIPRHLHRDPSRARPGGAAQAGRALASRGRRGGRSARSCDARCLDAPGPDLPARGESAHPWRLSPHGGGSCDAGPVYHPSHGKTPYR